MMELDRNLKTKEIYTAHRNNCEDVVTYWTTGERFSD